VCGAIISSLLNLPDIVGPRHVILAGAGGGAVSNALERAPGGPVLGILLCFATGFFLAGVCPPAFKFMFTCVRDQHMMAPGVLAAGIVGGKGMPHLVNGPAGLDWRVVLYATSALIVVGGLVPEFAATQGLYPFPEAFADPRQVGRVFGNPGVRLATLGYGPHGRAIRPLCLVLWLLIGWAPSLGAPIASNAALAMWPSGGLGFWLGGVLANRWG
jgi:hypothetical protein